jgi:hypothetical protein
MPERRESNLTPFTDAPPFRTNHRAVLSAPFSRSGSRAKASNALPPPEFSIRALAAAFRASALTLALASLAACGGGGGTTPEPVPVDDPNSNPIIDTYEALVAADHAALPRLVPSMDALFERSPEDGVVAFYTGIVHLWNLTRARQDPDRDLLSMALESDTAIASFERAVALRPKSEHAAAFLGAALLAAGDYIGNEVQIEEGRRVLDGAVPLNPAYVNGVRGIGLGALPRSHPLFAEAEGALFAVVEACGYESSGEDGVRFTYPEGGLPSARRVCNDSGLVAHVWEGLFLTFGDVVVKQGDAARARVVYENARSSPAYDRWLLRDLLEERIAGADARAALYLDEDPANDPLTWMEEDQVCVGCHASRE